MSRHYSPVDSDADVDETPVKRYRYSHNAGARQLPPTTPTRSSGPDNLERAMLEFQSPIVPASSHTRNSSHNASIASPTPQRHGSVSSSSAHSQDTLADDVTNNNEQSSHYAPWLLYQQHQEQQPTGQTLPRFTNVLPPIPSTSPLYQQVPQPYSAPRPFSSASGPQIVPVQTYHDHTRAPSVVTPASTGFGWPSQSPYGNPTNQSPLRNSYMSNGGDPYQRTSSHSRSSSPSQDDDDDEDDDEEEEQTTANHNHHFSQYSQYTAVDAGFNEKLDGDIAAHKMDHVEKAYPVSTLHYGPAPGRQARRAQARKMIPLTNGHLVVNYQVPDRLVLPYKGHREMSETRYTPITCDPDDFVRERYSLRQVEYGRQTELVIAITMYNENEILFCRTLYGVMKNIAHLTARKSSKVWGPDSWKKVVVCIIADGRHAIHPRVIDCLTALGVYQSPNMTGVIKKDGKEIKVNAHMFEYTCGFAIDPDLHFKYPDKGIVPTQIIFLMKEHNQKKINSHRWFFNAICPILQPNVCVLLDVGTRPGPNSLYHLWKVFDRNSNVGGACGEIAAYKGPFWTHLLNPLVAAQNYEYKMSNILDKPNESMFGYISVLPGAFSAYRYIALQNDKTGRGPLASYFKGEVFSGREADIFTSNMYLAEDRILSFELVAKANSDWILKYVKASVGETDVPDSLDELIMQRRRWLNGSFFAMIYSLAHIGQMLSSGHSVLRKFWLCVEAMYHAINLVFSWFAIGNFCIFFIILTSSIEDPVFKLPRTTVHFVNLATQYLLATCIMACLLFSMGNRPKAAPWKYNTVTIVLAILTGYMLACGIMCAIRTIDQVHHSASYRNMIFSILVTYGAWLVSALLALDPWHLVTCMGQYTLLLPLYVIVLNIYAFANLDDITWGTKGADVAPPPSDLGRVVQEGTNEVVVVLELEKPNTNYVEALDNLKTRKPIPRKGGPSESEKDLICRDYYANLRTNLLLAWAFSNSLLVVCILNGVSARDTFSNTPAGDRTRAYMTFVLAFVGITSIIRFLGSTMFMITMAITG